MSKIRDLGKELENLPMILIKYDEELLSARGHLELKGKTVEQANKEQASWPIFYDEKKSELKTLAKYVEAQVNKVRGKRFRDYTENYSRTLSDRAKDIYVDKDDEFLKIHELHLEILELLEKYEAVTEAFTKRGFALRNIGEARAHQFHNAML